MSLFDTIVFESKNLDYYNESHIQYVLENDDYWDEEDHCYCEDEMFEEIENHEGAVCITSFSWKDSRRRQKAKNMEFAIKKVHLLTEEYDTYKDRFYLYLKTTKYWRKGIDVYIDRYEGEPFEIDLEDTITLYLLVVPRESMGNIQ